MKLFSMNHRGTEAPRKTRKFPNPFFSFAVLCVSVPLWFNCAQAQPERADSVNPKTDKLWQKSDKAFHDGDYDKAILYHRQIEEVDPHDVESFGIAAWLMWSLGRNDAALAHIARGLKVNGNDWNMWDEAGQQYTLQAGRDEASPLLQKAKDAYVRAVELLPADADKNDAQMLRRRLAHAADHAGDLELSLATWKKLVEDYPDEVVNKNNEASVERKIADKQSQKKLSALAYGASGVALLGLIGAGAISKKLHHV